MVWALLMVAHGNRAIFTETAKEVGKLMMLLIVYRYHQQKGLTMIQGSIANLAFTYDNWVLSWVYQRTVKLRGHLVVYLGCCLYVFPNKTWTSSGSTPTPQHCETPAVDKWHTIAYPFAFVRLHPFAGKQHAIPPKSGLSLAMSSKIHQLFLFKTHEITLNSIIPH